MFSYLFELVRFGIAGGRSTRNRMNSGTHTVSVNERPAHVCRREQFSLSQTLGLQFISRGSVDVEPLTGPTHCVKQILLLSRFYRWTSFEVFYCFKTNQPTNNQKNLFPVMISLKLERSWEKGGDPCWLLQRLEASNMEENELLLF